MYSYTTEDKNNKTAKGVKKNIIKKEISHSDCRDVLFNNRMMHHQMKTIRSENHQISSYQLNKVSLSPFDDKRNIHSDGITSYAYGHYRSSKERVSLYKMMIINIYMTPEEVALRMIKTDTSEIDLKGFNNYLGKVKKRKVERRDKRVDNIKLSKEASKPVAARLRNKLIQRGKKPNLGPNFFAYTNL